MASPEHDAPNVSQPAAAHALRRDLRALQERADENRAALEELRSLVTDLDLRQRRTIWQAAAVISAAAPMLVQLLERLK